MIELSDVNVWLESPVYGLTEAEKQQQQIVRFRELCHWHYENCSAYRNIVNAAFGGESACDAEKIEDLPFLPVTMFKLHELRTAPQENIVKVLTSSGTTGQAVSKIFIDRPTGMSMEKALVKIMQHFLGKQRWPMIILDHKNVIKDRASFSARGAGILGMSQFGIKPFYALQDDLSLDWEGLLDYIKNSGGGNRFFLFGFTFMIWLGLVEELEKKGKTIDLSQSVLVHSGGWKKLIDQAVSPEEFRRRLKAVTGINICLNFYGMVEQVGGVFMENELHYLQASVFSQVIIRDPLTLQPMPDGEKGLVQILSVLPTSYPGFSILTEDIGVIRGTDHPDAGMKGKFFEILGRVPQAELRGCSDTVSSS